MASLNSLLLGGVKSVQRGTITFGWSSTSPTVVANITAVNPSKSFLITTGWTCSGGTASPNNAADQPRIDLINASQIQATRMRNGSSANVNTDISWQLVEFY